MSHRVDTAKEIKALRALAIEMLQRTSRLEEELSPVQGKAPRKGNLRRVPSTVERRNARIGKPRKHAI